MAKFKAGEWVTYDNSPEAHLIVATSDAGYELWFPDGCPVGIVSLFKGYNVRRSHKKPRCNECLAFLEKANKGAKVE